MNTQQKGRYAELRVEQEAALKGFVVSRPTSDARYDLVIDDGTRLYRVQVKYTDSRSSRSNGSVLVGLRRWAGDKRHITRNYRKDEIDALLVYIRDADIVCWIPPELFHDRPSIILRLDPARNNQSTGIHRVEDLRW